MDALVNGSRGLARAPTSGTPCTRRSLSTNSVSAWPCSTGMTRRRVLKRSARSSGTEARQGGPTRRVESSAAASTSRRDDSGSPCARGSRLACHERPAHLAPHALVVHPDKAVAYAREKQHREQPRSETDVDGVGVSNSRGKKSDRSSAAPSRPTRVSMSARARLSTDGSSARRLSSKRACQPFTVQSSSWRRGSPRRKIGRVGCTNSIFTPRFRIRGAVHRAGRAVGPEACNGSLWAEDRFRRRDPGVAGRALGVDAAG